MSYPELNEEEPVARPLLKQILESPVLLWELVRNVENVYCLQGVTVELNIECY